MCKVARAFDKVLTILKWPVAVCCVLLVPGTVRSLWDLVQIAAEEPKSFLPFLGGFALYFLLWRFFFRRPSWGSFFSTFEHELTHALFATLTFHRVVGLRTSWRGGGELSFRGKGNWLITISPYFFPTISVVVAIALCFIPEDYVSWAAIVLGVTVSYHATSTLRETHKDQPDLKRVGFPFAFIFLPVANVLSYAGLIAFAAGGMGGYWDYVSAVAEHTGTILGFIF